MADDLRKRIMDAAKHAAKVSGVNVKFEQLYVCPYCTRQWSSPNGTGSDVKCCGEIGHALPVR